MSVLDAYLRLVRRWRWSLLLAILVGTFLLQPLWPPTPVGELVTFTLAMLIFGGAIYAGRTGPRVTRPLVALLLLATLLQSLESACPASKAPSPPSRSSSSRRRWLRPSAS
jgi:hypothetical protein